MKNFEHNLFYILRRPQQSLVDVTGFLNVARNALFVTREEWLLLVFSQTIYRYALQFVSEDLDKALTDFIERKLSKEKEVAMLHTLYKYLSRISTRCTPFGLFAGWHTGQIIDGPSEIDFDPDQFHAYKRPDMRLVVSVVKEILHDRQIIKQLKLYTNQSLYRCGDRYRYMERISKGSDYLSALSSVAQSPFLQELLKVARNGTYLYELVPFLEEVTANGDEAEAYIYQLIDAQLLLTELEPNVTGMDYLDRLISRLAQLEYTTPYVAQLRDLKACMPDAERYANTQSVKSAVHVDMRLHMHKNAISQSTVDQIVEQITDYMNFGGYIQVAMPDLDRFKTKFIARYESQTIPLLEALDTETGLGYGINDTSNAVSTPLLNELAGAESETENKVAWNERTKWVKKIWSQAMKNGQKVVRLLDADMQPFRKEVPYGKLPPSFNLMGNLLAKDIAGLDKNFKFVVRAVGGSSAGNLLYRFCYADEGLAKNLKELVEEEEAAYSPAIVAELAHFPNPKVGNILRGPALRKYEIPLLTQSGVDEDHQIPLSDLLVSVSGNKVLLFSKRLGKQVIPRLTNAYNYPKGSIIYKFLADLQHQDQVAFRHWDWSVFGEEPFLPRVEYKNLVLKPAQWLLKKKEMQAAIGNKAGQKDIIAYIKGFCEEWDMPARVMLTEGDNELLIDWTVSICLEILADALKRKDVLLTEFFFDAKDSWLKDRDGAPYANEIILPLRVKQQAKHPMVPIVRNDKSKLPVQRTFITGSEWLYFKVYTGTKTADRILTEAIRPLAKELEDQGHIDRWFYIRYNDPDNHLRIRFHHAGDRGFWQIVIASLHERLRPFVESGEVTKLMTDTYVRELERYGWDTIEISEQFFHADSIAVGDFLDLIAGEEGEKFRWLFALKNIDMLLDDFGYNDEQKSQFMDRLSASFYNEINKKSTSKALMVSLNDKYRKHRLQVENILDKNLADEELMEAVECFNERSKRNKKLIMDLEDLLGETNYRQAVAELLPSYIHMTMNRTFLTKQRIHEMVIYHHLAKYYISNIKRRKQPDTELIQLL